MLLGVPGLSPARHRGAVRSRCSTPRSAAARAPALPAGPGAAGAGLLGVLILGVLRGRGRVQRVRGVRAGAAGGGRHGHPRRARRGRGDGLTPVEVARAQGNLRGRLVLGLEDTPSRIDRIGRSELDHGHQRTVGESLDRIADVTPEEVAVLGPRAARAAVHHGGGRALRRRGGPSRRAALTGAALAGREDADGDPPTESTAIPPSGRRGVDRVPVGRPCPRWATVPTGGATVLGLGDRAPGVGRQCTPRAPQRPIVWTATPLPVGCAVP